MAAPQATLSFDLPVHYQTVGTGTVRYPLVSITLLPIGAGQKYSTLSIVDSGADLPVFPEAYAHAIGIPDITTGPYRKLLGLGTGDAWDHRVGVEIFGTTFTMLIAFTKAQLPIPLLGREGFFEHFKLCFRQAKYLIHVSLTP